MGVSAQDLLSLMPLKTSRDKYRVSNFEECFLLAHID